MRIIFLFFIFSVALYAQDNKKQLAYQYFQKGEYDQAIVFYKELSKKSSIAPYYYPYFTSYFNLGKYKEARAISQKMIRKYPKDLIYLIDLMACYVKEKETKRYNQKWLLITKSIKGDRSQAITIANRFIKYQMFKYALDIYEKSEDLNNKLSFTLQKAQLYLMLGDQDQMLKHYFQTILENPAKKELVILNLERFLDNDGIKSDKNYQLVKKNLLRYIQKQKERTDFSEMLIWLFMKYHEFQAAFIQAKALDKRLSENGERIYDLAEIFAEHEYYELAISAYDYIIQKGSNNNLFIDANISRLSILSYNQRREPLFLDKLYQDLIKLLGKNEKTIKLLSEYAHFKAFFLHDLEAAEIILSEAMMIKSANKFDIGRCKLEYADIMLASNNLWEAILYYSQVEKEFKENPLGHDAKFRRAKVAFFQGDFEWAQAQLNVLKSSTSKLIANDAMKLALLITDNLGLDTTLNTMKSFAKAELLLFQNKIKESLSVYDSILYSSSNHSLVDEIYLSKSKIFFKQNDLEESILMLKKIIDEFPYDILADDATFELAKIYELKFQNNKEAMKLYESILINYQGSVYSTEARKRYRRLRGDHVERESL